MPKKPFEIALILLAVLAACACASFAHGQTISLDQTDEQTIFRRRLTPAEQELFRPIQEQCIRDATFIAERLGKDRMQVMVTSRGQEHLASDAEYIRALTIGCEIERAGWNEVLDRILGPQPPRVQT